MDTLLSAVKARVNEKRYSHILAVARECDRLSEIFGLSESEKNDLHISALLHDITKQYTPEEHIKICERHCVTVTEYMKLAPKTFHAITGAYLSRELFPESVNDTVFENILTHTTGSENMTLQQKLLYLADYIEDTRTFEDCVRLREMFYERIKEKDIYTALNEILTVSFDMTITDLIKDGRPIASETTCARNYLLLKAHTVL